MDLSAISFITVNISSTAYSIESLDDCSLLLIRDCIDNGVCP